MTHALTLLSFGWHLPYLRALARLGHRIDVVPTWSIDVGQPWIGARANPPTVRFVPRRQALAGLERRRYDVLIAHHRADLDTLPSTGVPRVLVVHHSPSLDRVLGGEVTLPPPDAVDLIVFPSDRAQAAWGRVGRVIPPGLDVAGTPQASLDAAMVLRVRHLGELAAQRLGCAGERSLIAGLPVTTLGLGVPGEAGSLGRQEAEIAEAMARCRLLLHVPADPDPMAPAWSVLEAMARGLPVIALAAACDPVVPGVSGFVGTDPATLRRQALALLDDADRARRMGLAARECVARSAGLPAFLSGWSESIDALLQG